MSSLLLLGAALVLILANGFFVAAEFGLVAVERPEAERAAAGGDRRAAGVVQALQKLSFQLSGTQLGITITSLIVGMLAEPALGDLLTGPLTAAGLPGGAVAGIAVVAGMHPALFMVAGIEIPYGHNEFEAAGRLLGEPVEIIHGPKTGLPLPAHAEIAFEGFVHPGDLIEEGRLRTLSDRRVPSKHQFYLLTKAGVPMNDATEAFVDWIMARASGAAKP